MKKINQYIIAAVIPLLGMLAACTDGNDWTVDNSANRQRTPDGLEVTIDEVKQQMVIKFNKVTGASQYQIQISENPLSEGFDDTEGYATFTSPSTENQLTLRFDNSTFPIKENTVYYLRARALSETKAPSKWITNDIVTGTFKVTIPPVMRIDDVGVAEHELTMTWHELDGVNPSYIINQNTGDRHDLTEEEKTNMSYKATGLEDGTEYTFILYDEFDNQIGKATNSTEKSPNMDWALSIESLKDFDKATNNSFAAGPFKVIFNCEDGKPSATSSAYKFWNPIGEQIDCTGRVSTGGKGSTITLEIPAPGRFYVYAYDSQIRNRRVFVKAFNSITDEYDIDVLFENEKTKENPGKEVATVKTNNAYAPVKCRIDEAGTYKLTYSASVYICGFCFVPDEEIKQDPIDVIN